MEFVKEILMFPFRSPTSDSCFVYIALGTNILGLAIQIVANKGEATLLKIWISCFTPLLALDIVSLGAFLLTINHNLFFMLSVCGLTGTLFMLTKFRMNKQRYLVGLWDYACQFLYHIIIIILGVPMLIGYFIDFDFELKLLLLLLSIMKTVAVYIFISVIDKKSDDGVTKEWFGCGCTNLIFILAIITNFNLFMYLTILSQLSFYYLLFVSRKVLKVAYVKQSS